LQLKTSTWGGFGAAIIDTDKEKKSTKPIAIKVKRLISLSSWTMGSLYYSQTMDMDTTSGNPFSTGEGAQRASTETPDRSFSSETGIFPQPKTTVDADKGRTTPSLFRITHPA
jgi:hypothetical protein